MSETKDPFAQWEEIIDPLVDQTTIDIYQFIHDQWWQGHSPEVMRASAATMCPTRRWYQRNEAEGTPLTPRKSVNFMLGYMVEGLVQFFIKQALVGPGKLYSTVVFGDEDGYVNYNGHRISFYKQQTNLTHFEHKGQEFEITSHADGFGKRNADGKWELIEVKSMGNWGFKSFSETCVDYLKQAHVQMKSDFAIEKGIDCVRFFGLRKETGHIRCGLYGFDQAVWEETKRGFYLSAQPEAPTPPHTPEPEMAGRGANRKPTGKYKLGFPCSYCPYMEQCHGPITKAFKSDMYGKHKPTFYTGG